MTVIPITISELGTIHKGLLRRLDIVKIGSKTERFPRDLRRLADTLTAEKDHWPTLV